MKPHETIEDRIAVLDNAALLKLCHDLAIRVTCFNAAEDPAYTREQSERELAKKNFWKVRAAVVERGLEFTIHGKGYML